LVIVLADISSDGTSLLAKANEVWLPRASTTPILLPVQVLKPAFVEFKNLEKHQHGAVAFKICLVKSF
jgi:hypothetical protein